MSLVRNLTQRPTWHLIVPIVAVILLIASWDRAIPTWAQLVLGVVLAGAIMSAVHHAEVVAARVGEPFGSLVLAVTVTVVEVALILTLVAGDPVGNQALARDTIFAALMITCNGIVGISLILRTLRGGEATFTAGGPATALAAIAVLGTISLVIPNFTTSTSGQSVSTGQLAFIALAALVIYLLFVFMQAVRHRDYFLPPNINEGDAKEELHAEKPTASQAWLSMAFLLIALIAVVGLAKVTSPVIEAAVVDLGLPAAAVGVTIALLVLLPESIAAFRAARRGRIQTSLNLGYGSGMASIGLTIPTIAVLTWVFGYPLLLGIGALSIVLLAITVITGFATLVSGRATLIQGVLHLSLLATFFVLVVAP